MLLDGTKFPSSDLFYSELIQLGKKGPGDENRTVNTRISQGASPVFADSQFTCDTVRAFVRQVGYVQAKAQARAAGMTAEQERMASRCFAKRN
jgi:hypothetical protein